MTQVIQLQTKSLLLAVIVLLSFSAAAQNKIQVEGIVTNKENKPIAGALITLLDDSNKILSYASSGKTGFYKIEFTLKDQISLSIHAIGYSRMEKKITKNDLIDKRMNFCLQEEAIPLDEVEVLVSDMEPDSVAINIDDLSLTENSNLNEILSKHPAFTVSDDGAILYRGKNIDKININGKSAFINQNKIALESIEKQLIESISIQNNYRDQFILGFEDKRETLLNINTHDDMQNIAVGDIEGAYGAKKKYQGRGKLLYFSKYINSFVTQNTNNFGALPLSSREINAIFNRQGKFSAMETGLVNGLFDQNVARTHDSRSTSTATLRLQKETIRMNSTWYYLANDRTASEGVSSISPEGHPIQSQNNINSDRYNTLFNATSFDWKPNTDMLVGYQLNAHIIQHKDSRNSHIDLPKENFDRSFNVSSLGNSDNIRMNHTLHHSQRFGNKYLWNNELNYERTQIEQSNNLSSVQDNVNEQSLFSPEISKSNLSFSTKLQYRNKLGFMPWTQYQIERMKETAVNIQSSSPNKTTRNAIHQMLMFGVSGEELLKYINYKTQIQLSFYDIQRTQHFFLPFKLDFSYDKRLYRYYVVANREYNLNHIDYAVDRIINYMDISLGNERLINSFNRNDRHSIGYAYNNLFKGRSWGISANHTLSKGMLNQNFLQLNNSGVRIFETRNSPLSRTITAKVDGAIRMFSSNYPVTASGEIGYQHAINTAFNGLSEFEMVQKGPILGVKLETLNSSVINFNIQSKANAFKVNSLNQSFDAQSFKSSFEAIVRKGGFEGRVNFLYWTDRLYGNKLVRRNVNFHLEYHHKQTAFGIRGRNVDDFFPVFDNVTYNNYIIINQGINTLVSNDAVIRYALIFFKYKFK
ncbi:carboxypeptidase-like regulatory domain-containing protein [Sphingobacterium oryzagri]|uniref:Carboxypeptidase-like regulatory domain-containing protein n=1 Tax=Sphingobacterium oryzagri TaxID=3025669 RepID=A0ABY7WJ37_9SPHI|nr:carboxypeptidase-like regulatory domain-containing protein [Sphingobacterium sp. KACC 22765]WDF69618.1 carboxypeptidase-like regulatory domain-containing protein [Sphingobacterium sp. KACC 22765]